MTAKEWNLIKAKRGIPMLYQLYRTKYNSIDEKIFEAVIRMWCMKQGSSVDYLDNKMYEIYENKFNVQG